MKELSKFQKFKMEMLEKGYGISASRRDWKASEYREMLELVELGLVRKTDPVPWNRAGAFVINGEPKWKS